MVTLSGSLQVLHTIPFPLLTVYSEPVSALQ